MAATTDESVREKLPLFRDFFRSHLLPVQLRHGARLIGHGRTGRQIDPTSDGNRDGNDGNRQYPYIAGTARRFAEGRGTVLELGPFGCTEPRRDGSRRAVPGCSASQWLTRATAGHAEPSRGVLRPAGLARFS